ncbi:marine proteobacterial sortase target protein [Methylobacterium sp. CM6241]
MLPSILTKRVRPPDGTGIVQPVSPLFLALLALLISICSASALPAPSSGSLVLRVPDAASPVEAPRLSTDFSVTISGPTARTVVTQAFRNTTGSWVEGTYLYPLPEDSAVDTMKLVIGDKVIVAEIRERAAAKRIYEAAKAAGQSAALTEQERPNVFTNTVANIGPGETVLVQIEYQQTVAMSGGTRSLRLPLVVAPRYNPAPPALDLVSARDETASDPVPDRDRITAPVLDPSLAAPVNPVGITVRLQAGFPLGMVRSATHPLHVDETGPESRRVTLADGVAPADRDFELTWEPVPSMEPRLGLFRETVAGRTYLLATVTPPDANAARRQPRDVVFVIDNSGSMSGASMRQAKAGLLAGLARLTPSDRFTVIRFDHTMSQLFQEPVPANSENLRAAESFVAGLEASGGTEMLAPLRAALADSHPEDRSRVRQIVFLTDGAIGDENRIFAAIHDGLGRSRLFMVGIGSAPNGHLMRHAAEIGRGSYTAIHTVDQVAERTRSLYAKLETPAVTDLAATLSNGGDITPNPLPDLYRGEPVVLAADIAEPTGTLTLTGRIGEAPWQTSVSLADAAEGTGISKVWARSKIAEAETARVTGRVMPNQADATILQLALAHKLMTRLTSLVAVDATPRRPAGAPLVATDLPLNLPAGWDFAKVFGERAAQPPQERRAALIPAQAMVPAQAVPLPQTAAGTRAQILLGLVLLLGGLLTLRRVRSVRCAA